MFLHCDYLVLLVFGICFNDVNTNQFFNNVKIWSDKIFLYFGDKKYKIELKIQVKYIKTKMFSSENMEKANIPPPSKLIRLPVSNNETNIITPSKKNEENSIKIISEPPISKSSVSIYAKQRSVQTSTPSNSCN
jgi:hypothetical protein